MHVVAVVRSTSGMTREGCFYCGGLARADHGYRPRERSIDDVSSAEEAWVTIHIDAPWRMLCSILMNA